MKKLKRIIVSVLVAVMLVPGIGANAQETRRTVLLGGIPFGLKMYTGGVIVVNVDDNGAAKDAGIRESDVITRANGEEIKSNEQLQRIISDSAGEDIELSVLRGKSPISVTLTPEKNADGATAGMWVRDSTAGLGTVTYYDESNHSFGALGHGIYDRDTGMLMPLGSGETVKAEITSVTKAQKGVAGGLNGCIGDENIGTMTVNSGYGVFGLYEMAPDSKEIECALNDDIHLGEAAIYTTVDDGEPQTYKVEVADINIRDESGRNMIIRVIDDRLTEKTGGIVQGMSGSPIIQDGRLIGAVTHVFVNDPEKGYGISIGNMLNCYEKYGSSIAQ